MKPPANPVLPEDLVKFDAYVVKWQQTLNLLDWRIVRVGTGKGVCAEVQSSVQDHLAHYRVGPNFGAEPVNDWTLERIACHEMIHVLLAELIEIVATKQSADIVNAAEHRIVHTLERLLVPKP